MDKQLKDKCEELNRSWSEKYVSENNDLTYIKKMWNLTSVIQEGISYNGGSCSPWSSVEQTVTDCYLDLIQNNTAKDSSNKRVESLMYLYNIVIRYLEKTFDNKQPENFESYLKSKMVNKEISSITPDSQ